MQLKTIKKTIEKKLNEWLETITDLNLRERVKQHLLVSGGSITSMLLGDKVNDFDIYLQDMNTLLDLTKYYTQSYNNIRILDGRQYDKYDAEIHEMKLDQAGALPVAVRNLKENQIKLFFDEKSGGMKVNEACTEEEKLKYIPRFFSPNAISLSNDIQIVLRFNGNPETIHKTFDFIHATNYFTFAEGLVTNKEALESIITKQLRYQGSQYPLTSIIRVRKFLKRNWNIGAGELLKIMFQISELDLKNPDVLEEQLIGVDIAYFDALIKVLRGIDDLQNKLTSQYLNTIIDKVFNEHEEETD